MSIINIGGKLLDLSTPKVMGIVNATPDSFFEQSRKQNSDDIIKSVSEHLINGADIIDIGGYSTRPLAEFVSEELEISRVLFALEVIGNQFGNNINVSIDTFRSAVVKEVLKNWGNGFIVNDVQAAEQDSNMLKIVSENDLPYIAMHSKGTPKTMSSMAQYDDVVNDILDYFVNKLKQLREYCIKDVIFDVGFGFAKTVDQNYELVKRFEEFDVLDTPQLVGVSRKKMICSTLNIKAEDALNGTSIVNTLLLQKGAKILRVHDSLEAKQIIEILKVGYNN